MADIKEIKHILVIPHHSLQQQSLTSTKCSVAAMNFFMNRGAMVGIKSY